MEQCNTTGSLAVDVWEAVVTGVTLSLIILFIIVGNTLVILSVFTYKPLRTVQNFFIVSLAVADLTVAVLVLPLNIAYSIQGQWLAGIHVCKMWLTFDVMCCTASILNLCAIALDRYWAITDPINYAQKRTMKRVVLMITGVWVLSLLISSPPLLGWNDWGKSSCNCKLTEQQGFVIYSSLGSFYIPLIIMIIVYVEIYIATKRRLRERAAASKLHMLRRNNAVPNLPVVDNLEEPTSQVDMPSGDGVEDGENQKNQNKEGMIAEKHLTPMLGSNSAISPIDEPSLTTPSHSADGVIAPPPNGLNLFIEEKQRISLSKERRAARTLGIIMGVFIVCWLPFFLMYVILPFCESCCVSDKFVNFITWLGYVNSALNPIIYTVFNLDFRRAFKKLLHIKSK